MMKFATDINTKFRPTAIIISNSLMAVDQVVVHYQNRFKIEYYKKNFLIFFYHYLNFNLVSQ